LVKTAPHEFERLQRLGVREIAGYFGIYDRQNAAVRAARNSWYKRKSLAYLGASAAMSFFRTRKRKRFTPSSGFTRRVRFRGATSMASSRAFRPRPAGVRSGQGVTVQHDARTIYRSKRMPRRRRKIWKRFTNKVHAVAEKDMGSRTVVFNYADVFTNTTGGNHGVAYMALYPGASDTGTTGKVWLNDLTNMSGYENTGNPTAAAGITIDNNTKWVFKSAILDITFRNSSTLNVGGVQTPASEAKLEVDVYEFISGKVWQDTGSTSQTAVDAFGKGSSNTLNIGGAGTGIDISTRGATPWDIPMALGYYKIKILRKTKYFVNNGDTFTYQIRDPKRRVMMQESMQRIGGPNVPRWTRHLLVIFKLVPGLTVGSAPATYTESLTFGLTRKYFYKVEGANEDRDRWVNA